MANTDDFYYKPDMRVVLSARNFIKSLIEVYGSNEGLAVWDKIRNHLSEQMASDIFVGMLIGPLPINIVKIGPKYIEVIKEVRRFTGMGLKESKDFVDGVNEGKSGNIDTANKDQEEINRFCDELRKIGCVIN